MELVLLFVSLIIILVSAEIFVNGVEWIGKLYKLSEGAVGSVLAAVGTALPETLIPIIAILFGVEGSGHDIGIGAILGAPLMLSTLAMFVTGIAVIIFRKRRKTGTAVTAHYDVMSRDLVFFIIAFGMAVVCGIIPGEFRIVKIIIAVGLVVGYVFYVHKLITAEAHSEAHDDLPTCYAAFGKPEVMEGPTAKVRVIMQVIFALGMIIVGANLFVTEITVLAEHIGIPVFILSLIIAPIATELPEKFNSVIWVSRGKDTFALGNITGAMVFQSTLIPAIGILLTDWQLNLSTSLVALLSIISAGILLVELKRKKHIEASMLVLAGVFYVIFIALVIMGIIR